MISLYYYWKKRWRNHHEFRLINGKVITFYFSSSFFIGSKKFEYFKLFIFTNLNKCINHKLSLVFDLFRNIKAIGFVYTIFIFGKCYWNTPLHCLATGCAISRSIVNNLRKPRRNHYEYTLLSVLTNTLKENTSKPISFVFSVNFFPAHMTLCLPLFNKAITPSVLKKKLIISIVFRLFRD